MNQFAESHARNADDDSDEDDDEDDDEDEAPQRPVKKQRPAAAKQAPNTESLSQLKKRLADKKASDKAIREAALAATVTKAPEDATPFEHEHVLTQEDFQRIKRLKVRTISVLSQCLTF